MTQLRSCYFCGAVGDSLQEYEMVPERLVSPGESRSTVLCSTCHEKLRRVLEPLVEPPETPSTPDRSDDSLEEVTFGATEQSDGDPDADMSEEATEDTDDETTDETTDDEPSERAADPDAASSDAGDDSSAETADVPDGYYKVIRLLQNREFPMERAALTGMVTSAYDVTEPQCERILQTAIDRGVLVEDGATIDIGRN